MRKPVWEPSLSPEAAQHQCIRLDSQIRVNNSQDTVDRVQRDFGCNLRVPIPPEHPIQ